MKFQVLYYLVLTFIASTLCAEMFEDSVVPYSYDIEMNNDDDVIKYLVDSTYYDQFSVEILGVYVMYNDIPIRISKDLKRMAEVLDHYIFLRQNPNYKIPKLEPKKSRYSYQAVKFKFNQIKKTHQLFQLTSQDFHNQEADARELSVILQKHNDFSTNGLSELHLSIGNFLNRKTDFYTRQNDRVALKFCDLIRARYLYPIQNILNQLTDIEETNKFNQHLEEQHSNLRGNFKKLGIKGLNKDELKVVWDEFKESKLGLIQTYFKANDEKLIQLDANNTFQVDLDYVDLNGMPKFYICLNLFGQKWYLRIDDYYVSEHHKISLIKL